MASLPDRIAALVHERFDELPAKRKPAVRTNGLREWVPLSAIVAQDDNDELQCLSLATGMKCLPAARVADGSARGDVLHDWHAEVLAIRAFNRLVLDECLRLARDPEYRSPWLRRRGVGEKHYAAAAAAAMKLPSDDTTASGAARDDDDDEEEEEEDASPAWTAQPFAFRDSVRLHMYCSEAPCGDASMELTMAAQEDASPWALPVAVAPEPPAAGERGARCPEAAGARETEMPSPEDGAGGSSSDAADLAPPGAAGGGGGGLPGRGYFSLLGAVRRKPARADAPPTLSKSCSDKLARRQCLSLLSGVASLLVAPLSQSQGQGPGETGPGPGGGGGAYLSTVVLPAAQHSESGCRRAFSAEGRMGRVLLPSRSRGPGRVGEEGKGDGEGREEGEDATAAATRTRAWAGGYAFRPFEVRTTSLEFAYSRRALAVAAPADPALPPTLSPPPPPPSASAPPPAPRTQPHDSRPPVPSNLATACIALGPIAGGGDSGDPSRRRRRREETTVGGALQGRRAGRPGCGGFASRRALWGVAAEVAEAAAEAAAEEGQGGGGEQQQRHELSLLRFLLHGGGQDPRPPPAYADVKAGGPLAARRRVKRDVERCGALRGWVGNRGDEGFRLAE